MPNPTESPAPPRALVGWRLLALAYDFFPMLALWFITAGVFTAIHRDAVRGGWLGLLEFAVMWLLAGAYAVASWRRGGQTLGMRAWRLRVTDMQGTNATTRALWLRYAVGRGSRGGGAGGGRRHLAAGCRMRFLVGVDRPRAADLARPDQQDADDPRDETARKVTSLGAWRRAGRNRRADAVAARHDRVSGTRMIRESL